MEDNLLQLFFSPAFLESTTLPVYSLEHSHRQNLHGSYITGHQLSTEVNQLLDAVEYGTISKFQIREARSLF